MFVRIGALVSKNFFKWEGGGALIREGALIGTEGTKSNHHGILPISVGEAAVLFGGLGEGDLDIMLSQARLNLP